MLALLSMKKRFALLPAAAALVTALLSTGPLLGCAAQEVADSDLVAPTILDLSEEFTYAADSGQSVGAQTVTDYAVTHPTIRTVLVLEHGQIVAEYVREDVDPRIPNPVWSTTKSWISLLIGCMVQDGLIALDETLGDIFEDADMWDTSTAGNTSSTTDDSDTMETMDNDMAYRQAVTLKRMLSMTSGLMSPLPGSNETEIIFMDGGNLGGASMTDSLMHPRVEPEQKGAFQYLASNNILSYVIQQRTNRTPREYLAEQILPYLGIDNEAVGWWQNEDGVEYAYHGMLLTPLQMAKFGQLYLQQGLSNATHSLINPDWIEASTSLQGGTIFYGYLVWVLFGALFERPELEKIFCSQGLGGQDICVSPLTDRVIVQQRDLSPETEGTDSDNPETLEIIAVALDPGLRFSLGDDDNGNEDDDVGNEPAIDESGNVLSGSHAVASSVLSVSTIFASLLAFYLVPAY